MRLFVAIELPEEVRRRIAERVAAERDRFPAARWVRPQQLHLTLLFLGEVADSGLPVVISALAAADLGATSKPVAVAGAGAFPGRGPLRVVWLGLEPTNELERLAAALRSAAASAGLPFDAKPFHPHLTLARCRVPWPAALRSELARLEPAPHPQFRVERARILSSVLDSAGPHYTPVAELPLREAA